MGLFENCCCFFDLRIGSALSGVYSLVTSCIPFVGAVLGFISLTIYTDIYAIGFGEDIYKIIRICLVAAMSIWGLHIFTSFLLLLATCKNDHHKMIPYMVFTGIIVFIHLGGTSALLYMLLAIRVPYVASGPFAAMTLSLANGIINVKKMTEGRETWGAKAEFILSTMGYSIGLGNVWRFPYLCYDNGGGAFLIPYFLMIAVGAIPVLFLEASLGQFTSLGCVSCWNIAPFFKGIGMAMVLLSGYFCLYYNLLLTYILYFMFSSFKNPLPWVGCNHSWNTDNCFHSSNLTGGSNDTNVTTSENLSADVSSTDRPTTAIFSAASSDVTTSLFENDTISNITEAASKKVRASEEFWRYHVLDISDGLHDIGSIQWRLLLCFIAAWIIVYFCIIKGVKSSGKVVYFTATFPYVVLFVLLIRGATLPGAADGILFFIKPKWNKLRSVQVWKAAANQVFFSFTAGWGGVLTLASYNKFRNDCYRDVLMVSTTCGLTSLFSGFVIFSIIGFMARDSQLPVEKVVASGPGLAFIVYPEAVAKLPAPQVWSFLFFFMLLTVGLDSQFVTMEVIITATVDELEAYRPGVRKYKRIIILITCILMLLVGLPLVTQGGIYIMTLLDWYSAGFTPMILAFIEMTVVSYAYGTKRFMQDIHSMIGYTPSSYWRFCWMVITPTILLVIYIFSFIDYSPANVGDYVFPPWGEAIGWLLTLTSVVIVFVYGAIFLYLSNGTFVERLKHSVEPAVDWGPALNADRARAGYAKLPNRQDDEDDDNANIFLDDIGGKADKKPTYVQLSTTADGKKHKDLFK